MGVIKTTIGDYLLKRIKELGIDTIFGVPGDFNMKFLDLIEDDPDLVWGNNANELNAAYAADGYARVKGAGCVVTTFGVGELSATNGIAGSYSEMVPVIHIVGTPKTSSQASGAILHHTLGNGDFNVFMNMFASITAAHVHLTSTEAARQIDTVINESMRRRRPGYIGIPIDIIGDEIEVEDNPLSYAVPKNPADVQAAAIKAIMDLIHQAKNPIVIADACVQRNHLEKELHAFLQTSGFPSFVAPMGKGTIDPVTPGFRGCFSGAVSLPQILEEVKQADLVLQFGAVLTDFNTGGFTGVLDRGNVVSLHTFATYVQYSNYEGVGMKELVPLLTAQFPATARRSVQTYEQKWGPRAIRPPAQPGTGMIQDYFWEVANKYMAANAIIVVETGTVEFASINFDGPPGASFISQVMWGSIGFSLPAALGAAIADRSRRVYLLVGDGSFQLTAQEVSVMLHHGVTPVILLFNNDGYVIEKMIHGPTRKYNDFQMWNYAKSFDYFGADLPVNQSRAVAPFKIGVHERVTTRADFDKAMAQTNQQPDCIHFLELIFPRDDVPQEVLLQTATSENK
ncbi:pyruvate decarboxylase [Hesseltinella vesiculosa]|uniref:Pyruvate decarboxylase n=1 Tax=Hesseltinella vesiculosa TaxID=101127 RepID=A0A1X2GQD4_9FUNG|nr:pyruvate decarboxylase [Hesseltinella vesiculosa]